MCNIGVLCPNKVMVSICVFRLHKFVTRETRLGYIPVIPVTDIDIKNKKKKTPAC